MIDYIDSFGWVGVPMTLRCSGVWRHGVLIQEAPQWSFVPTSDPATVQLLDGGLLKVTPVQEGRIHLRAMDSESRVVNYTITVVPGSQIETYQAPEKIGLMIERIQFADLPELPSLPPAPPPEE
jgi:hypothetical protein